MLQSSASSGEQGSIKIRLTFTLPAEMRLLSRSAPKLTMFVKIDAPLSVWAQLVVPNSLNIADWCLTAMSHFWQDTHMPNLRPLHQQYG